MMMMGVVRNVAEFLNHAFRCASFPKGQVTGGKGTLLTAPKILLSRHSMLMAAKGKQSDCGVSLADCDTFALL